VVLSGGNVDNGTNDGPFYRNCNNSAANSNWNIVGRPLCYLSHFLAFLSIFGIDLPYLHPQPEG